MREKYQNALMWALYAALALFVMLLQTVSFGHARFFDTKLCFLPVLVACVAMHTGSEAGAVFGMALGLFWTLTGADGGALYIVLFSLCGALAGYLCQRYLFRSIVSALMMSLMALCLCQMLLFFFKCFLSTITLKAIGQVFLQIGLSMLACPFIYLAARAIRKAGA